VDQVLRRQNDKIMRLYAQTATIENGFVYLPSEAPGDPGISPFATLGAPRRPAIKRRLILRSDRIEDRKRGLREQYDTNSGSGAEKLCDPSRLGHLDRSDETQRTFA
jgi:hypothetical protein